MSQINLWCGKPHQQEQILQFHKIIVSHPDFTFYHPNWTSAPWHLQAHSPNGTVINFWPHLMKGQIESHKSVQGAFECDALFEKVRVSDNEPDFLVFEEYQVYGDVEE